AEDGIRDLIVTGVQRVLFRSLFEAARGQSPEHPVHAWRLILTARYNPFSKAGLMAASKSYSLTGWVLFASLGAVSPALAQSRIRSEERRVGKECRARWAQRRG